jgi:hypothetical protein
VRPEVVTGWLRQPDHRLRQGTTIPGEQLPAFRQICIAGNLDPTPCPVMHHNLIYLFYGRPAYRPGQIDETNMDRDSRPVFLLFKADSMPAPYAVYPCDSGALKKGLYAPHLDGMVFHDLDCSSQTLAEQRIVTRYFGGNEDYFYGAVLETLVPVPTSPAATAFHTLLTASGSRQHDDRCLTIEVLQTEHLPLVESLGDLLVPDFLLIEPTVHTLIKACEKAGVRVRPYRPQTITNAARTVEQEFHTIWQLQGL